MVVDFIMHIRQVTVDDIPAYVTLRREMLRDSPWSFAASEDADIGCNPEKLRARLQEPAQAIFGAFDADCEQAAQPGAPLIGAGGLVGIHHAKMAHRAIIWGVYVSPKSRGRGVGEAIIHTLVGAARTWPGVDSVALSVSERSNAAQRLYERCGFVAWGREPRVLKLDGVAYDEIHMIRMLD